MRKKIFFPLIFAVISIFTAAFVRTTFAAVDNGAFAFSITPPLFKINMEPGGSWSSTVKIVNNNAYAVTVYPQAADFKSGPAGGVEFLKSGGARAEEKFTLSQWIDFSSEAITLDAFGSRDLPFTIKLPATADPGGHYAAILVGNKPPEVSGGSTIKISSKLASLILVRVSGEVVEQGEIREFSTQRYISGNLETKFKVRFVNTGNVHLHPEGEIIITNLFGEVRGRIPVNQSVEFGNILPESEKEWEFSWQGKSSILDAGLLRAELVLSYGDEAKQSAARKINFWVFNSKPTITILSILLFLVLAIVLFIKRYIKKSINMATENLSTNNQKSGPNDAVPPATGIKMGVGKPPVNFGSSRQSVAVTAGETKYAVWSFFKKSLAAASVLFVLAAAGFAYYSFRNSGPDHLKSDIDLTGETAEQAGTQADESANGSENIPPISGGFTVSSSTGTAVSDNGASPGASSSAPAVQTASSTASEAVATTSHEAATEDKTSVSITVLNGSGVAGLGAKAAATLKTAGYTVAKIGNADNFNYQETQIRYLSGQKALAEALDQALGGNNLLQEAAESDEKTIVVILGKNFK